MCTLTIPTVWNPQSWGSRRRRKEVKSALRRCTGEAACAQSRFYSRDNWDHEIGKYIYDGDIGNQSLWNLSSKSKITEKSTALWVCTGYRTRASSCTVPLVREV